MERVSEQKKREKREKEEWKIGAIEEEIHEDGKRGLTKQREERYKKTALGEIEKEGVKDIRVIGRREIWKDLDLEVNYLKEYGLMRPLGHGEEK